MVREDGIIRSRLPLPIAACLLAMLIGCQPEVGTLPGELPEEEIAITIGGTETVSYTHLTLPTIYSV